MCPWKSSASGLDFYTPIRARAVLTIVAERNTVIKRIRERDMAR
jgi:hypothetical protein